jgi:MFS family permease
MPDSSHPIARGPDTSRREFRLVLTGLMLALTLAALDQNIVATALPRITGELGGLQHLSWVVTAFVVASTVTAPLYGRLSDLYGRKPAFTVSIVVFLIGSVLCGMAGGMIELIVFRAVQGLGAGGLIVLAQTVIGDLVSPRERGRYQGLFAAVFTACWVASSPNTRRGAGSSTSTCRSAPRLCCSSRWACSLARPARRPASTFWDRCCWWSARAAC